MAQKGRKNRCLQKMRTPRNATLSSRGEPPLLKISSQYVTPTFHSDIPSIPNLPRSKSRNGKRFKLKPRFFSLQHFDNNMDIMSPPSDVIIGDEELFRPSPFTNCAASERVNACRHPRDSHIHRPVTIHHGLQTQTQTPDFETGASTSTSSSPFVNSIIKSWSPSIFSAFERTAASEREGELEWQSNVHYYLSSLPSSPLPDKL